MKRLLLSTSCVLVCIAFWQTGVAQGVAGSKNKTPELQRSGSSDYANPSVPALDGTSDLGRAGRPTSGLSSTPGLIALACVILFCLAAAGRFFKKANFWSAHHWLAAATVCAILCMLIVLFVEAFS